MTRYFFHLLGPDGRSDDLIGCEFETADAAYLEVCRAAAEIGGEMLERRENPTLHRFEICDEQLGRVMEAPFREVLRTPLRPWEQFQTVHDQVSEAHELGRQIKTEVRNGIDETRACCARSGRPWCF